MSAILPSVFKVFSPENGYLISFSCITPQAYGSTGNRVYHYAFRNDTVFWRVWEVGVIVSATQLMTANVVADTIVK